jgi:hypothetical protein
VCWTYIIIRLQKDNSSIITTPNSKTSDLKIVNSENFIYILINILIKKL